LSKVPKRELALSLVKTASSLIEKMLRLFPKGIFDDLRVNLCSDTALRKIFEIAADKDIDQSQRELVEKIVDAYEFALLGYPMRIIFSHLGNIAGQAVLRLSISSIVVSDPIENLIAQVWASEIDAQKSKKLLIGSIISLPPVPFIRISLSTHFMTRVYWNQWEHANRLVLLDAAVETLRPLHRTLDKGRLMHLIEHSEDEKS
jgi:hypothetical protein